MFAAQQRFFRGLAPGAHYLLRYINEDLPEDQKVDYSKLVRELTVEDWAKILRAFEEWPFKPEVRSLALPYKFPISPFCHRISLSIPSCTTTMRSPSSVFVIFRDFSSGISSIRSTSVLCIQITYHAAHLITTIKTSIAKKARIKSNECVIRNRSCRYLHFRQCAVCWRW